MRALYITFMVTAIGASAYDIYTKHKLNKAIDGTKANR